MNENTTVSNKNVCIITSSLLAIDAISGEYEMHTAFGRVAFAGPSLEALQADVVVTFKVGKDVVRLDGDYPIEWKVLLEKSATIGHPVLARIDNQRQLVDVAIPSLFRVVDINSSDNGKIAVELHPSALVRELSQNDENHQKYIKILQECLNEHSLVWVTDRNDGTGVEDVRKAAPDEALRSPIPKSVESTFSQTFGEDRPLDKLFTQLQDDKDIPFLYPDDGCWARAHEMFRLALAAGIRLRKIWLYGKLRIDTPNSPVCQVAWFWHVAPVFGDDDEVRVLDPALFQQPVRIDEWIAIQGDQGASHVVTDGMVFHRTKTGEIETDEAFETTRTLLERYRMLLSARIAKLGEPPYKSCAKNGGKF